MAARGFRAALAVAGLLALGAPIAVASTQQIDLDGQASNGAESKCDLNVLSSFPVKVENVVTNKAVGLGFTFSWLSAGPGGFTSACAPGTTAGVGAKWTWTTNQSIFSYTGTTCSKDICFSNAAGSSGPAGTCTLGCFDDGVVLTVNKSVTSGQTILTWTGGAGPFNVYRSESPVSVKDAANLRVTTSVPTYTDVPPGGIAFYQVWGATCVARKACATNADCNLATEGTCVARGPFSVPGRSLTPSDITVSSASLTSSLITFFSPPHEIFRITSTAQPGGVQETLTNDSTAPVTVVTEGYPPGCCPADPAVPHQLRCGEDCVDYLHDPLNCGACGNVCGEGACCSNGSCAQLCAVGQTWCDGQCVDFRSDLGNCGACGNACGEDECCSGGSCIPADGGHPRSDPPPTGICPSPSVPVPAVCPSPGPPAPVVLEAPICTVDPGTATIPPGGSSTTCRPGGVLFQEVPSVASVCGDSIPGPDGACQDGVSSVSSGTFMRLVPDTETVIGDAFVTPFAAHVLSESSGDGLIGPGETASLLIDILNAGPALLGNAAATLTSPAVDLTDDGVENPVAVTIVQGSSSYGDVQGTQPAADCGPVTLHPVPNAVAFQVTLPADHPGDVSRPFSLELAGTVNGSPFSMAVPLSLGIRGRCQPNYPVAETRDYDGLDGLFGPMAKLVPEEDAVRFPVDSFVGGSILPLHLRLSCAGVDLTDGAVVAPEIVGLSEATRGAFDVATLTLNDDTGSNDPFFRFTQDLGGHWVFHMRSSELGTGTFTLKIRIAGRKDYVTGFVLR